MDSPDALIWIITLVGQLAQALAAVLGVVAAWVAARRRRPRARRRRSRPHR